MENIDVQIQLLNKIGNAWFFPTHKDSSQYRNWCGFNATMIFATDNVSRLISWTCVHFPRNLSGVCSFVKSMSMYNMKAEYMYPKQFRDEINWLFFVNHLDAWGLFLCWFVFNIQNCCHLLRLFLSLKIHQLYPCKKEKSIFFWDNWFV